VSDIGGVIGAVLSSPPLRYIGRISYGLYVIHFPINLWLVPYFTQLTKHASVAGIIASAVKTALAALSWRSFEGPINRNRPAVVDALLDRAPQRTGQGHRGQAAAAAQEVRDAL